MLRTLFTLAVCFALSVSHSYAQTDSVPQPSPKYKAELIKMFESVWVPTSVDSMLQKFEEDFTDPDEMGQDFPDKGLAKTILGAGADANAEVTKGSIDIITPFYEKNISIDDLEALNRFYETEAGKRIAVAMPVIHISVIVMSLTDSHAQTDTIQPVSPEYKAELIKMFENENTPALKSIDATLLQHQSLTAAPLVSKPIISYGKWLSQNKTNDIITIVAPVYEKHISLDDIKALNKFYESEQAKRILVALPKIIVEAGPVVEAYQIRKYEEMYLQMLYKAQGIKLELPEPEE